MMVNSKRMEGASVMTQSGTRVGKLSSCEFDADTGRLAAIIVRPSGVVTAILGTDLAIAWGQIVSMSEEAIVVRDAAVLAEAAKLTTAAAQDV